MGISEGSIPTVTANPMSMKDWVKTKNEKKEKKFPPIKAPSSSHPLKGKSGNERINEFGKTETSSRESSKISASTAQSAAKSKGSSKSALPRPRFFVKNMDKLFTKVKTFEDESNANRARMQNIVKDAGGQDEDGYYVEPEAATLATREWIQKCLPFKYTAFIQRCNIPLFTRGDRFPMGTCHHPCCMKAFKEGDIRVAFEPPAWSQQVDETSTVNILPDYNKFMDPESGEKYGEGRFFHMGCFEDLLEDVEIISCFDPESIKAETTAAAVPGTDSAWARPSPICLYYGIVRPEDRYDAECWFLLDDNTEQLVKDWKRRLYEFNCNDLGVEFDDGASDSSIDYEYLLVDDITAGLGECFSSSNCLYKEPKNMGLTQSVVPVLDYYKGMGRHPSSVHQGAYPPPADADPSIWVTPNIPESQTEIVPRRRVPKTVVVILYPSVKVALRTNRSTGERACG